VRSPAPLGVVAIVILRFAPASSPPVRKASRTAFGLVVPLALTIHCLASALIAGQVPLVGAPVRSLSRPPENLSPKLNLTPRGNISSKKRFTSPVDKRYAEDYGVAVVLCLVEVAGPDLDPPGCLQSGGGYRGDLGLRPA
jgi:hypothetical protein